MLKKRGFRGPVSGLYGLSECKIRFRSIKDGKKIIKPEPEQMTDIKCEKCNSPMLERFGKRGPFLIVRFPNADFTMDKTGFKHTREETAKKKGRKPPKQEIERFIGICGGENYYKHTVRVIRGLRKFASFINAAARQAKPRLKNATRNNRKGLSGFSVRIKIDEIFVVRKSRAEIIL
jgi:hypothetical protein